MKYIKDYLHLYLGCKVRVEAIENKSTPRLVESGLYGSVGDIRTMDKFILSLLKDETSGVYDLSPILRPLSDTTEEEADFRWNNFINIKEINQQVVAEEIRWLLLKHFDLFNLIEDGLAIDKTKIPAA